LLHGESNDFTLHKHPLSVPQRVRAFFKEVYTYTFVYPSAEELGSHISTSR